MAWIKEQMRPMDCAVSRRRQQDDTFDYVGIVCILTFLCRAKDADAVLRIVLWILYSGRSCLYAVGREGKGFSSYSPSLHIVVDDDDENVYNHCRCLTPARVHAHHETDRSSQVIPNQIKSYHIHSIRLMKKRRGESCRNLAQ